MHNPEPRTLVTKLVEDIESGIRMHDTSGAINEAVGAWKSNHLDKATLGLMNQRLQADGYLTNMEIIGADPNQKLFYIRYHDLQVNPILPTDLIENADCNADKNQPTEGFIETNGKAFANLMQFQNIKDLGFIDDVKCLPDEKLYEIGTVEAPAPRKIIRAGTYNAGFKFE